MGYTPPHLNVRKVSGGYSIYPDGVTTEDLKIMSNPIDATPYIQLNGLQSIQFYLPPANAFRIMDSADGEILRYNYVSPDCIFDTVISNKNLFLKTNGTGTVKFGTYTAGAATDSTGYITITDAGGTTRKLMVQA